MGFLIIRKGIFRLESYKKARLFIHSDESPYILLQTKDELVIVNFRDAEKTRAAFE